MMGQGFGDEIAKAVGGAFLMAVVLAFAMGAVLMKTCDGCHYRIAIVETRDGGW